MTEPRHRYWGERQPPKSRAPLAATIEPKADGSTAVIRLYDPIDSYGGVWGVSAKEFAAALDNLPDDVKTIDLHINSPGGEVTEGYAMLNTLRDHPAAVNVTIDGLAASAASFVAMAGDQITMARNAQMMIHRASGLVVGNAEDMTGFAGVLDKMDRNMAGIYADRAGGSVDDWLSAMTAETWYLADEAVEAGLADRVAPKEAKATAQFDLTIFAHAGREQAPAPYIPQFKPPAEPPEQHPTHTEEAVTMTPEDIKALRERLGLADDADIAAITARLDELEEAATKPNDPPEVTDETIAAHLGVDSEKLKAAIETAKDDKGDKVTMSKVALEELQANAKLGVEARKQQLAEARDKAIQAAVSDGKISRDRVEAWTNAWDKDPAGVKADLESLEARFPVGDAKGYAGSDGSDGEGVKAFTDDEAEALAQLAGVSKEALTNG